jgi:hypothetical protein
MRYLKRREVSLELTADAFPAATSTRRVNNECLPKRHDATESG